jgi:hypothetical protein
MEWSSSKTSIRLYLNFTSYRTVNTLSII